MSERKMVRNNEIIISELLNGKNYFVNYNIIKEKINNSILKKRKIYLNFEDVLFSKILLNQIQNHISENSEYIKYVVFLNNMPLLNFINSFK